MLCISGEIVKMFDYKYLGREHLEGFDNYKYMAKDTSPLSVYVMHPFWNRVVELVPRWVAPNVLTFAGFMLTVLDFALLSFYDYDYYAASTKAYNSTNSDPLNGHTEVIPQSLWYLLAVFLFLAYTLDGIDGKQARRTQTSGPLGELFDHGLDSYSVFFIPACLYSIFGRLDYSISPIRMYYVMWNLLLNFYISHWEKYNTGVLFLPWGYDFSMWTSTFVFLWTGAHGTSFYKRHVFGTHTLADAFEWLIYATGVFTNLPVAVYNIYQSYEMKTGKMRPPLEAVRPLWSLLSVWAVCSVWVHGSRRLPSSDPRALFLLIGTLFSNVAFPVPPDSQPDERAAMRCPELAAVAADCGRAGVAGYAQLRAAVLLQRDSVRRTCARALRHVCGASNVRTLQNKLLPYKAAYRLTIGRQCVLTDR